jgi:hypothetical protein
MLIGEGQFARHIAPQQLSSVAWKLREQGGKISQNVKLDS